MTGTNVRVKGIKRYFEPKSGKWYCYHRASGVRIEEEFGTAAFFRSLERFNEKEAIDCALKPGLGPHEKAYRAHTLDFCCHLLTKAKQRAKAKGTAFSLSKDDIASILDEQGYVCGVTKKNFDFAEEKAGSSRKYPYRPSLDRIDSGGGYIRENVRIVLVAVNIALCDWGDAIFREITSRSSRQKR